MSVLLLSLLGCPSSTDAGDTSDTAGDCASLDPTTCATRDDCTVIQGRPLEFQTADTAGGPTCYVLLDPLPLGCMDLGTGCDEAETFGASPDGECAWFATGCQPQGWVACDPDPLTLPEC